MLWHRWADSSSYVNCPQVHEAFVSAGKPRHRCVCFFYFRDFFFFIFLFPSFPCRANKTFPKLPSQRTYCAIFISLLHSTDTLPIESLSNDSCGRFHSFFIPVTLVFSVFFSIKGSFVSQFPVSTLTEIFMIGTY